jgi:hypothetical protein
MGKSEQERMQRMARAVAVGMPHHITQRGNQAFEWALSLFKYLLEEERVVTLCLH